MTATLLRLDTDTARLGRAVTARTGIDVQVDVAVEPGEHTHIVRAASLDEARTIAAALLLPGAQAVPLATVRGREVHVRMI